MQLVRVHRVMFMVDVSTCGVSATGNTQTLATKRHGEGAHICWKMCACWPPVLQGGPSDQQLSLRPAGSHHYRMKQVSACSCTPLIHPYTPFLPILYINAASRLYVLLSFLCSFAVCHFIARDFLRVAILLYVLCWSALWMIVQRLCLWFMYMNLAVWDAINRRFNTQWKISYIIS